ncbi:MAG TPA: hypothetical protein VEP90_13640, partial [Methylomirabilota bacterium]|nr:hypothetical protein [Methylomirabilota bacterium]
LRLEVMSMKFFKITRSWVVKAEDEAEAFKLVASDQSKYLDTETVTRTEYKKPQQKTGWGQALKDQVLGANGQRK